MNKKRDYMTQDAKTFVFFVMGGIVSLGFKIAITTLFETYTELEFFVIYFIVQIVIVITSFVYHSNITFKKRMSLGLFIEYVKALLGLKLIDYLVASFGVYFAEQEAAYAILLSTILVLIIRFLIMRNLIFEHKSKDDKNKPKNVVTIIGGSYGGNKGAELMVSSVVKILGGENKKLRFNVLSYYPKEDKGKDVESAQVHSASPMMLAFYLFPMSVLESFLYLMGFEAPEFVKNGSFRAIEECDLFIDVSGISFSDGREIYLPFNILCILPPILLGKKVVKFSQAMGPFNGILNRSLAKFLLPRVDRIFAREEETLKNLRGLGLENVELAADSTFCVKPDQKTKRIVMKRFSFLKKEKKIVGISPSSVVERYCSKRGLDYAEVVVRFIKDLNKEGYSVVLIPHSMRKNSKSRKNNDYMLCKEIAEKLGGINRFHFIDEELSGIELRAVIGFCDFYITSRFHGMISGLSMKVPTLVIGWGHKYLAVMSSFGLQEYVIGYEAISLEMLERKFNVMVRRRYEIRKNMDKKLGDAIKSSERNYEYALGILRSS